MINFKVSDEISKLNENVNKNSCIKNVCIFGQGYVGLPLSLSFAFRGCNVIGVDVNKKLVNDINNGVTYHTEKFNSVSIQDILKLELSEKRYIATTNAAEAVKKSNNIIVTVGIPIKDGKHITDYLEDACKVIGKNLKKDDVVVIRSTVIPGTTEDLLLPILERESGIKAGKDFYLSFSSERIAEGNAFEEFANMPTIAAGINEVSLKKTLDLLSVVCKAELIPASCIKAVETAKVFENVQRDVNIAMSQEFARFTEALGIDIFEVIKLANTHKRVNLLTPGPGVGGYCIPNAYHYIAPKANEMGVNMEILKLAREKNSKIPEFIVNKTEELLKNQGKLLKNSKIAVLGLAMKDYSSDDRISPPINICKLLLERGANVKAFDPVVPTNYDFKVNSQNEALMNADLILILTKQKGMDFKDIKHMTEIMNENPICIDGKAVINSKIAAQYGLIYWRI